MNQPPRFTLWGINDLAPSFHTRVRIVERSLTERDARQRAERHNANVGYDGYGTRYVVLPDGQTPEGEHIREALR